LRQTVWLKELDLVAKTELDKNLSGELRGCHQKPVYVILFGLLCPQWARRTVMISYSTGLWEPLQCRRGTDVQATRHWSQSSV